MQGNTKTAERSFIKKESNRRKSKLFSAVFPGNGIFRWSDLCNSWIY